MTLVSLTRSTLAAVLSCGRAMIGVDWLKLLFANTTHESREQVCPLPQECDPRRAMILGKRHGRLTCLIIINIYDLGSLDDSLSQDRNLCIHPKET